MSDAPPTDPKISNPDRPGVVAPDIRDEPPRRRIDTIVAALRTDKVNASADTTSELLDELGTAVYAVLGLADRYPTADLRALFFKGRFGQLERRFIASCLLRVIAADRDCFPAGIMAKNVLPLFDELLEPLYKKLSLGAEHETHNKLAELVGVAPQAEAAFERAIFDIKTIDDARRFQSGVMHALNDATVAAVVKPSLPEGLFAAPFRDLISALAACSSLVGHEGYERYEAARAQIADFQAIANAHDSEYADRYLSPLADRLATILEEHAARDGLTEPARLAVRASTKRYPLHVVDHEIRLRLTITNEARGSAFDVRLMIDDSEVIVIPDGEIYLGDIPPGERAVFIPALVAKAATSTELDCLMEWSDASGHINEDLVSLTVLAQPADVDWESLDALLAYPHVAVRDDSRLAGRHALMTQLENGATGAEVASVRISGQKRIGKSSVVQSLASRLVRLEHGPLTAYVDVNKLMAPDDPNMALRMLMRSVSEQLISGLSSSAKVDVPEYETLGEFNSFLEELRALEPGRDFLVIIDEFDEMPNAVFERGGPGDALFRGFKAFSSDGDCGFILVGGETMDLALAQQNDRLNAFVETYVGFLGEDDRSDFVDLVTAPVQNVLTYDSDAVDALWERTGGHPFFTFEVCRVVVDRAKLARDSHVTRREIEEAYEIAVNEAAVSAFAHVWFDGIFADAEEETVIANRRVRVLLAWAKCLRSGQPANDEAIITAGVDYDLPAHEVREELRSFVRRRVLVFNHERYEATSRFFGDWLRDTGIERIRAGDPKLEAIRRYEAKEEKDRVKPDQIIRLTERWSSYQGMPVGPERVRAWLEQFGEARRQRLAFTLLERLQFFSARAMQEAFRDLHRTARRDTHLDLDARLTEHRDAIAAAIERSGRTGILAVVAGFEDAAIRVSATVERLGLDLTVHVHHLLDATDRAFHRDSTVFDRDDERLETRQIVERLGQELHSREPLGNGKCEALIVFEHNVPNNTLPVIWKTCSSPAWRALFARTNAA